MVIFKLAWREVINNRRFSVFFVINMTVALAGLLTLDSVKNSIQSNLKSRSKAILAADFAVSARRHFSEDEVSILEKTIGHSTEKTEVIETFSMVSSDTQSRLVELRAIQNNYPFYGTLRLMKQGLINQQTTKDLFNNRRVWVYPELLLQLNLEIGDSVKIGNHNFQISDVILEDSAGGGGGFSFALPVYISRDELDSIQLIQNGSTFHFSTLYKLSELNRVDEIVNALNTQLTDPAIRVTSSENASAQIGRMLKYLGDYLGLAAVVALFLTALGQIFLFRNYLQRKFLNMGIYKVLGLGNLQVIIIYLLQILILSAIALVPSIVLVRLALFVAQSPVQNVLQLEVPLQLSLTTIFTIFILIFIGTILICAPILWTTLQQNHRNLFQPAQTIKFLNRRADATLFIPAVLSFFGLTIWLSKSFVTGSLFFGLFLSSILIMSAGGWIAIHVLKKFNPEYLPLRLAIRNLRRDQLGSISAFVTFGLVVTLASLIPTLEKSIQSELATPGGEQSPSLFIFDIQEEQIEDYFDFIEKQNVTVLKTSPMIRARLQSINSIPFEKVSRNQDAFTREQENENRFRNRGFNLSYQQELSESEKILSGHGFSPNPNSPEISIEKRFADRLNMKLGDHLEFDIQGVTVTGTIINIRKVRWTSFQPNFFILFSDGPLNNAPKTYLSTIGPLSAVDKSNLQLSLARSFPNISTIDVSQVIQRISRIVEQMSLALTAMAGFTFLVGLFILTAMTSYRVYGRRFEFNLMKILGASARLNRNAFILETTMIVTIAATLGVFLSIALSYILTTITFDSELFINHLVISLVLFLAVISSWLVSWFGVQQVLLSKPILLLRQSH